MFRTGTFSTPSGEFTNIIVKVAKGLLLWIYVFEDWQCDEIYINILK